MRVLQPVFHSDPQPCQYLPEKTWRFANFYADEIDAKELDTLLSTGWRTFGLYYFQPRCPACAECVPIRIIVDRFAPTKSQRRNARKNNDVRVELGELRYSEEAYAVYEAHSRVRFNKETTVEEFLQSFYNDSCPSLQSNYYLGERLIGVGFLSRSTSALSSAYFVFDPAFSNRGLGTFSIIKEVAYAALLGLRYYYLGFVIAENRSMSYKVRFGPNEKYDWKTGGWETNSIAPVSQ